MSGALDAISCIDTNESITFWQDPDKVPKEIKNKVKGISFLVIGVESTFSKGKFVFNGWIGSSYSNAEASNNLNNLRNYDNIFWDYSFNGFSPLLGFKLGYFIF